ncbi:MAG: hypothetical protein IPK76_08700 [Lewinellaceae bacterium]|jgi:hypothetical protein|nr:hypothetical protein [Lewinellaceae bacterium]
MKSTACMLLLGIVFVYACSKDNGRNYWGEISVLKNGEPWSGKIVALPSTISDAKFNISIMTYDENDIPLDELGFIKIPKKSGMYPLSFTFSQPPDDSLVGANYFHGYDDELYDIYSISEQDSTSYLEITEFNEKKGEIRGKFNVTMYRTLAGSWNGPDTLVFTDGAFHTRIDE